MSIKRKFLAGLIGVVIFGLGAIVMEFNRDSIKSLVFYLKSSKTITESSETVSLKDPAKRISTVNYPLLLTEFDLTQTGFAKGAGSLGVFCGKLAILDRTGAFFSFEQGRLQKLFQIDNNFTEFSFEFKSDASDMLRTHNFTSNKNNLFVSYTKYDEKKGFFHLVSRYSYNCQSGKISSGEEILLKRQLTENQALNTQAAGGALLLDGDRLYTSIGFVNEKKWSDPEYHDIEASSGSGTTVEINLKTLTAKTFTQGHRNITSIIKRKNTLISVEHAMKGGDEINTLMFGSNYGYPYETYGTNYSSYAQPYTGQKVGTAINFEVPTWAFVPSVAPGDSLYLENSVFERWNDSLIIAGLKSRSIFVGKFDDDNIVYMEPIFIGDRVRSLSIYEDTIYLLTDNSKVVSLQLDIKTLEKDIGGSGLVARSPHLKKCVVCHSLEPRTGANAPHLYGIIKRPIASTDYDYTENFAAFKNEIWTKELLIKYLRNPDSLVSGTSMPNLGLSLVEAENIFFELSKVK